MFSWRKGHVVTKMVDQYVGKAEECLTLWRQAFEEYLRNGFTAEFGNLVDQTHVAESECDDIRRNVEASLYERALIPESRGDIAFLLEAVDRIPSKADQIVHIVQLESLAMPPSLADRYSRLVELNCECFSCLAQAVRLLFTDMARVPQLALEIDKKESAADKLERELIRAVFADAGIAPDQRILLRDLVLEIDEVSDRSEHASDRLTIMTMKRMV